jgi:enoyl-CoA hydratase/carnithine racemase
VLEAEEAGSAGLLDLVCPADADFGQWFAEQLAPLRANPPQVMRAFKSIALSSRGSDRAEADRRETAHFARVWAHQDHWDAVARLDRGAK